MKKSLIYALAFGVLSLGASSCASLNSDRALSALVKGSQAMSLSNDDVAQYVAQSVKYMDAQNNVAPASSPYTQRLNILTNGITHVGNIPLNFKVYITDDINAFACADGSVRVYTGIMDIMNDDELLGIIGHEIGHVAKEHSKNALKQEILNSALLDALASTSTQVAQLTDSQLGTLANSLMSAKFSRTQENEADDYGYDFLKANGKNPYGMVQAFEKMLAMEQSAGNVSFPYQRAFSSHPDTQARIKHMTERCKKDGYIK